MIRGVCYRSRHAKLSEADQSVVRAAANAISVLVCAGVSMSGVFSAVFVDGYLQQRAGIKHITIDAVCLKHAQNGRGQGPRHGHLGFQGRDRSDSSQLKIASFAEL